MDEILQAKEVLYEKMALNYMNENLTEFLLKK